MTDAAISQVSVGDPTFFSTTADAARVAFLQDLYPQIPTAGWLVESEDPTRVVFSLLVGTAKQAYVETRYFGVDGYEWYGSSASVCSDLIGPLESVGIHSTERTWEDDTD